MNRSETTYTIDAGVAVLTLNRPEIRNALTGQQILDEIITTIQTADASEDVTVLIITGEGSAFSAGGNVKDMESATGLFAGDTGTIAEGYRRTIQRLTSTMAATDLVTIAAVNGPAIGAGFDLALGCDLRIGSTNARFAHTFADLGILPGDGGAWILPRVVGWQRAAELAFTARIIDAEEAAAMDVLLEVVDPDRLMDRCHELATTIAAKPSHSIRLTKRLFRHARHMDLPAFLDLTAAYQAIAHADPQHRTAVRSFLTALETRPRE